MKRPNTVWVSFGKDKLPNGVTCLKSEATRWMRDAAQNRKYAAEDMAHEWDVIEVIAYERAAATVDVPKVVKRMMARKSDDTELLALAKHTLRWREEHPHAHLDADRLRMAQIIVAGRSPKPRKRA